MSDIRDYPSRVGDPASRRFETFSYLPPMDAAERRAQVQYIVDQHWQPAIEHVEPARAGNHYWYMWKLPMFGVTDAAAIEAEIEACHQANPGHHVRLIGYDPKKQTQGLAMVVIRGDAD